MPIRELEIKGKVTPAKIPGVIPALLTFLFYCAAEYTVGLWGSSFLVEVRGLSAANAATGVSLFYIGITAGRFLSGFLTKRFSAAQLIRAGIFTLAVGILLMFLPLPGILPMFVLLVMGLGCAPIFPSMVHETPRRFGAVYSQKIIAWQLASSYVGAALMPPLVGLIANKINVFAVTFFMLIYVVVLLICTERINKVAARQPNETSHK